MNIKNIFVGREAQRKKYLAEVKEAREATEDALVAKIVLSLIREPNAWKMTKDERYYHVRGITVYLVEDHRRVHVRLSPDIPDTTLEAYLSSAGYMTVVEALRIWNRDRILSILNGESKVMDALVNNA